MDKEKLINNARKIIENAKNSNGVGGTVAEATEFLRKYAGENSYFLEPLLKFGFKTHDSHAVRHITSSLEAFIRHVENDLHNEFSLERKAQIDVVSDFLEQAHLLLITKGVHPAAPTVITGACLEEFLRNWIEENDLSIVNKKPGLDAYAGALREANLITKQDMKDITSWCGLRNLAAHGKWDEVNDKKRIGIMLEHVNLFMRKYGEREIN